MISALLFCILVNSSYTKVAAADDDSGWAKQGVAYQVVQLIADQDIRQRLGDRMAIIQRAVLEPDTWDNAVDHIYLPDGTGYGPQAVADYFTGFVGELKVQDWDSAASGLGYLISFYMDMWNPFCTSDPNAPEKDVYGVWLDQSITLILAQLELTSLDTTKVDNIKSFAEDAATHSRALYSSVVTAVDGNDTASMMIAAKSLIQGAVNGLVRLLETSFNHAELNTAIRMLGLYIPVIFIVAVGTIVVFAVWEWRTASKKQTEGRSPGTDQPW